MKILYFLSVSVQRQYSLARTAVPVLTSSMDINVSAVFPGPVTPVRTNWIPAVPANVGTEPTVRLPAIFSTFHATVSWATRDAIAMTILSKQL